MKRDETGLPRLRPLADVKPGLLENAGEWLRKRFGLPEPRDQMVWRSISEPPAPQPEAGAMEPPAMAEQPADAEGVVVETATASSAPLAEPRRVTVLGAPHPVTMRLFRHIEALVEEREPDTRAIVFNFATSSEAAEQPEEGFIYLRSDCAGGCRIAAAHDAPRSQRLTRAATLLTRLDDRYWHRPNLSVEAALRHGPYFASRLSELLQISFGPVALQRSEHLFAERARDAELYCDPLGYLSAVDLEAGRPDAAPSAPPAVPSDTASLLAQTLSAFPPHQLLFVARDPATARLEFGHALDIADPGEILGPERVLQLLHEGSSHGRAACLIDMADEVDAPDIVDKLQGDRWVLCGVEHSVEAVRRFCGRCLDAGVGHHMTFVFEGVEWKAFPRPLFEG